MTHLSPNTLRLVWPQWEGAGIDAITGLAPEFSVEEARNGYVLGSRVLDTILPEHDGATAYVPVSNPGRSTNATGGIESREEVLAQLRSALSTIAEHDPESILTLGGDCSVSVAPFSALAEKYGDDLAVVWIDSHPDTDTPETAYSGYHAMAVSMLLGHGNPEFVSALPARLHPSRVALAGLHAGEEDALANARDWGVASFSPPLLRSDHDALLAWLRATGCSRVAIHIDVDVVDSDEVALGLGTVPGGLRSDEVRDLILALGEVSEVVALTVAEYFPRQVMRINRMLSGLPLI